MSAKLDGHMPSIPCQPVSLHVTQGVHFIAGALLGFMYSGACMMGWGYSSRGNKFIKLNVISMVLPVVSSIPLASRLKLQIKIAHEGLE